MWVTETSNGKENKVRKLAYKLTQTHINVSPRKLNEYESKCGLNIKMINKDFEELNNTYLE